MLPPTVVCAGALIVALAGLGTADEAKPAEPGLLSYWRLDDGQGDVATDSSGQDHDGDIGGAEWVKGRFGTALHFGGRDAYVTIPALEGLNGSDELTAEAWVYWEKGGRYPNILTAGSWNPGGFLVFVADNGCSFRMGKPGERPWQVPQDWAETGAGLLEFSLGRWYHLAATFRRPEIRTYVDGKPVGSATWDYPVGALGDLQIGTWGNPDVCHTGLISEVKLYNRALSPDEIMATYAQGASTRGPVAAGEKLYEKLPAQVAAPAVTLENDTVKLLLDRRARVIGFIDQASGKDHCAKTFVDFATATKDGKVYRPSSGVYRNGTLTLTFGRSALTAEIKVTVKERYFVLELSSVSDPAVDEFVMGGLRVGLSKRVSASVAWAADDEFAAVVRPLNLQVDVGIAGGAEPAFSPRCFRRYGLTGAKVALAGCPAQAARSLLQEIVRAEGLPYSPLGGPFAADAEENRGSYLFSVVSEANVNEWIELGRRGGFAEIHLCPWWRTMGHYEPNPDLFPHGMDGLKQVVRKLHAAGFKVGMHTLTGCIQVDDPWVSPVPDKRLARDASFTLAAAIGPDDKTIPTTECPRGLETFWSDMSTGNTIRIGDEIIAYSGISRETPYGFTGCTRGHWGTHPAAHDAGAPVDHLWASYCSYMPDESTTLVDELAERIANAYNTCGFDMIYFDGSEGMGSWHAVAVMKQAIFTRLKRRVLVESSSGSWGAWPFHSRVGAWDHPRWGFNRFTDLHCEELERYCAQELLPGQMGWWVITGPSSDCAGMFPEDMEYFCGKCLGWDRPLSLEGVAAGQTPPSARQDEYLTMLGRYERLRLSRYFTDELRRKLRTPNEQFRLTQDANGTWQLQPTDYAAHKVTSLSDGSSPWTVRNRFAAQPVKLRIEALYSCAPYDSPDGVVLTDFAEPEDLPVRAAAAGVACGLSSSAEQVKVGAASGCLTARNGTSARRGAWVQIGKVFTPPLDMGKCAALGVWVYGDGKGELLNLQLNNSREYYTAWDDHYVDVRFTGWRYFELLLRERDAQRHQDYVWPYGGPCEVGRTPLLTNRVGAFSIYANGLPPNDEVRCYLAPVRALPTKKVKLTNPTVTLGGKRLVFPVTLESGQYVEFESAADCRLHDERGAVIARLKPQGDVPVLAAGENPVAFTCEGPADCNTRANVTVISQGAPLGGQAARGKVDWSRLRTEYEDPRTICAPGPESGSWEVVCRSDAKGATLEAEIAVEAAGKPDAGYESPNALTIESFDDLSRFADGPRNQYAQYVYDSEHHGIPAKPGVTQTLAQTATPVRVGASSARFTATSTRNDDAGWCARGERFDPVLNLSDYAALGFWVYGDGQQESLKLQLRDTTGAWQDMVTPVDFTGWKYVQFDLGSGASLNLAKIEYLILFHNGLPGGKTVTCWVDDARALRTNEFLKDPALTVNGCRILFPVAMAAGERLVYRAGPDCRLYGRNGVLRRQVEPSGPPPDLKPGRNQVQFAVGRGSSAEYRVRVSLTKLYR